jgi:hypothetical protein
VTFGSGTTAHPKRLCKSGNPTSGLAVSDYRALAAQAARRVRVDATTVELEPWLYVGDPLAEQAVRELQARRRIRRNLVVEIRRLALDGNEPCQEFLRDVETPPAWADFDAMRAGGALGKRNPLPLILGMHGTLPMTYADGYASPVLVRTARLANDLPRRLFETATLFLGALDSDEMRPGRREWERCVRIRLMHTMVRLKILDSGDWDHSFCVPINQLSTGAGPYIFGVHRVRMLRSFGAPVSDQEAESFELMWRYVTRVMGCVPELIGHTPDDQRILSARIMRILYRPNSDSRVLTRALHEGLPNVPQLPPFPRSVHEALSRRVLAPELLPELEANVADDLGVPRHPVIERAIDGPRLALRLYGALQRIRPVQAGLERLGGKLLRRLLEAGLQGVPADYHA